jgi:hypothetical protein
VVFIIFDLTPPQMKNANSALRIFVEVGFIIFLFYSNLLMGEYDKTGNGDKRGLVWALGDIFTIRNFAIAITASIIGFFAFEFLRKKT